MKKLYFLLFLSLSLRVFAQIPGDVAQNFGATPGFNNSVFTIAVQPDGKILLGGNFTTYNGVTENRILRLNADGTKDTSFTTGTGCNNSVRSISVQSDGKILLAGDFTIYKGIVENYIIRLNTDGTKDTSFNTGTGFNSTVWAITIQPDGKILMGGDFTTYNGVTENYILRLNANGTKDTSFNAGTGFNSSVTTIAVQPDGKILLGGYFTTYKGVTENRIIRLNTDGTKDTSFNTGTGFNTNVWEIAIQPDGKILVGGDFTTYKGVTENHILRLNANGAKDTSFNTGTWFNDSVRIIAVKPDGKLMLGGNFTTYNDVRENRIIRLNTDGTKDTSFNTGTGFNNIVWSLAIQPDGKTLVGGSFITYKGVTENRIVRLNIDGTKDTSFNTGTGFNSNVYSIAVQPDGKILVGGDFTTYKGVTENRILRLNTDGTKDTSFNTGTGFNNFVYTITVQPDGKILMGGNFTSYKSVTEKFILRLNTDGTKDTSLNTGTGFDNLIYTIAVQPDGKIIMGGNFYTYNGAVENRIIRLNTDGTKDTSFNTGTGFDSFVHTIAVQPDGKILVGGIFVAYRGVIENRIIRLNTNGTKDTSFSTGTGFNSTVWAIAIQPDGKILVGGDFTTYRGVIENCIIRLNADGSKNTSFSTGAGFNNSVNTIALQPDGKILMGGGFTTYKSSSQSAYLIALHTEASLGTADFNDSNALVIFPNPVNNVLNIKATDISNIQGVKIIDLQGKVVLEKTNNSINVSTLAKGLYIVKIVTDKGEVTKKFIKE